MAKLYLACLVVVLTVTVVQCVAPTCSGTCTSPKTCQWTCDKSGVQIPGASDVTCTAPDAVCGTGAGVCKSACVAPAGTPACTSPTCTGGQTCQWTCDNSGTAIDDAYLTACTAASVACGSATENGQCKAACLVGNTKKKTTAGPGNGCIKYGLSPLILLCGILAKLFLSP